MRLSKNGYVRVIHIGICSSRGMCLVDRRTPNLVILYRTDGRTRNRSACIMRIVRINRARHVGVASITHILLATTLRQPFEVCCIL